MEKALITLPKHLAKGEELVILSRRTYERLVESARKRVAPKLDRGLLEALVEVERGQISRSFKTSQSLLRALRR